MSNLKFFKVSFKDKDGVSKKDFYVGETPQEALSNCKKSNYGCKSFRVNKTAFNTLGEKI